MKCRPAQHCAVAAGFAQAGQFPHEFLQTGFGKRVFSQLFGHVVHLAPDRGVRIGQVGVAAPGVDDTQAVPGRAEVELDRLDPQFSAAEVNADKPADGGRHLVHKPRGLAEIFVFRILARRAISVAGTRPPLYRRLRTVPTSTENAAEEDRPAPP